MRAPSCGPLLSAALALALPAALAAALWPAGAQPADEVEAAVLSLLGEMPSGSGSVEAEWLYTRARALPDARVALRLMDEAARRSGAGALRAQLWQVRYWAAAGESDRARQALRRLRGVPLDAEGAAERCYWALRLADREAAGTAPEGADRSPPPWRTWAALAGLASESPDQWSLADALSLEGDCRRWGLLGPWLWQLLRSPAASLRSAAAQIHAVDHASLSAAPEALLLDAALQAREALPAPLAELPAGRDANLSEERPTGRYAVQVGSYDDPAAAEGLLHELATHGFQGHLAIASPDAQPPTYRVRLGPHEQLAAAESLAEALSRELMLPYQIVETP